MTVMIAFLVAVMGALVASPGVLESDVAVAAERVLVLEHWTNFA